MKGFSSRNLKYMSYFAKICPDLQIGQQSAAQLPWFHIVTLLTKISDPAVREWYAREAFQQAWSRDTLVMQIKNQLVRALPEPLDTCLPTIEELETELSRELDEEGLPERGSQARLQAGRGWMVDNAKSDK
jgi:hypothetical protein